MSYVDGFVIVVPKKNIDAYKQMAEEGAVIWKKYGALDYKECVADDLSPNMDIGDGQKIETMPFPKLLNLSDDETVVFSYIVYRDRAHRDEVNKKVMNDPSMTPEMMKDKAMPFDMKKFSYGGFQPIVEW
ncbi:MAG: DUF1428 domain-containing protein [Patescibacteria group bacterium]